MLTGGEHPFTGEQANTTGSTSEKLRWEQINLAPPSPRKYNPALPITIEDVILRCLDKDPTKRFSTALELQNALENAINQKPTPVIETKIKKQEGKERKKQNWQMTFRQNPNTARRGFLFPAESFY